MRIINPTTVRRDTAILAGLALLIGVVMAMAIQQPGYTDAFYYFNGGARLAAGHGLTDAALWTYLGAPAGLPIPSHLYWMPLASLVEAIPLALFGGAFHVAQIPLVLCYAGLVALAYQIGLRLGDSRRIGWLAAILTTFSGYFMPYWANTDTFALYGLIGALALAAIGWGRSRGGVAAWAIGGILCGLAHLTRADGVLFLIVLVIVALWPERVVDFRGKAGNHTGSSVRGSPAKTPALKSGIKAAAIGIIGYLVIMTPWFARDLNAVGAILPVGGFQTAWMRSYDEIAAYPPGASISDFLAWGTSNILRSRGNALIINVETLIAVEGLIVVTPLMLGALWRRRFDPLLSPIILYALGLHTAMSIVFAFPGPRGGLLHSASPLVPFWMALGAIGLDGALTWAARRRRWPLEQSKWVFSGALIVLAAALSGLLFTKQVNGWNAAGVSYRTIGMTLPHDAVVMVNDPPAFYYATRLSAVVVPNSPSSIIPTIAARYGVTYLILDANRTAPLIDLYEGRESPSFLTLISDQNGVRVYRIKAP